jgi:hypothetical protein
VCTEFNPETQLWKAATERGKGLQEVPACGGDFWLIRTALLKRMERPLFRMFPQRKDGSRSYWDYEFQWRAKKELGVPTYVDWDVDVGHKAVGHIVRNFMLKEL